MAKITPEQIGLRDAAEMFGVSIDTLRRRIRDNQLDEAELVQGPFGATWVLPRADLAAIAAREHWDLATEQAEDDVDAAAARVAAPAADASIASPEPMSGTPEPMSVSRDSAGGTGAGDDVLDLRVSRQPQAAGVGSSPQQPAGLGAGAPERHRQVDSTPVALAPEAADLESLAGRVADLVSSSLAQNVEAELAAVRDAITAAEVRAVSAEATTEALRSEQGRVAAQLKRAEADAEYWRSQHDRLDKELDREQGQRMAAETAHSAAQARIAGLEDRVGGLEAEVARGLEREKASAAALGEARTDLSHAQLAMGWWSRRRLAKLQARASGGAPPPPPQ